jgi:hypothetical protein
MSTEQELSTLASVVVVRHRDAKGLPDCEPCEFFRSSQFGFSETCVFQKANGIHTPQLQRREGGSGSIQPFSGCPVWTPAR